MKGIFNLFFAKRIEAEREKLEADFEERVQKTADKRFSEYKSEYQQILEDEIKRKNIQWPFDKPVMSLHYPVDAKAFENQIAFIKNAIGIDFDQINFSEIYAYRFNDVSLDIGQPRSGSTQFVLKIDLGGSETYRNWIKNQLHKQGADK